MITIAQEIEKTVERAAKAFSGISDAEFALKKIPGKWSKKEIVGHLIDSAQNNIQRFVRGQYEDKPKIVYAQDDWVILQDYQHYDKEDLIQFWILINRHLCRILLTMKPMNYERQCNTGKTQVELHSLVFLADDYRIHMIHHLKQAGVTEL